MKYCIIAFLIFLAGCYSPCGMWFRSNFSFGCPNRYEKEIVRNSCNAETVRLKLEEHLWSGDEQHLPEKLAQMKQQVIDERLYINDIHVGAWRGDTSIVIFASNIPTSLADKDELAEHKYRKIREEKCKCRLCR